MATMAADDGRRANPVMPAQLVPPQRPALETL